MDASGKTFTLTVNGKRRRVEADPQMPLLWVLRDRLELTGTKYGCGMGTCGACTVHEGGRAVRSCTLTLGEAAGKTFTTIEGLSAKAQHPCQLAWLEEDVAQCGFCQPGMIMEAAALLRRTPKPTEGQVREALGDHVCRCGTYPRVLRAVQRAAAPSSRR